MFSGGLCQQVEALRMKRRLEVSTLYPSLCPSGWRIKECPACLTPSNLPRSLGLGSAAITPNWVPAEQSPPPGKDPQESIVGLLLPGHPPHCLSVLSTPSHGPANRHMPPKVTHRGSSTWIPHPENHMSPSPQAQPQGGDRPHSSPGRL